MDFNLKKNVVPKLKSIVSDSKLTRKSLFSNKKPPLIKHTKTSMYRMLKANPLMELESELFNTATNRFVSVHKDVSIVKKPTTNPKPANVRPQIKNKQGTTNKMIQNAPLNKEIRRSLSAGEIEFKKQLINLNDKSVSKNQSAKSLNISPIKQDKRVVTFKTPTAYNRRSRALFVTPTTPFIQKRCSTPYHTTSADGNNLKKPLKDWINSKGKSLANYHHLVRFNDEKCHFEEDKENIETIHKSESYEDLGINDNKCKNTIFEPENLKEIANDAINDLHKLILEGFSSQQCEAWLEMIKKKCPSVEEQPQFWECRAAIEQALGNIATAVEFYRTAIVQGAEVKKVDESLEQLLQKFSLLNISTDSQKTNEDKKKREKIVLEARNAFKSTIIKFAIQERGIKNKNDEEILTKKFVATPVRRSTRQSICKFKSTPGVTECSSLKELDKSVQETLEFHSNKALFVRYGYE